MATLQFVGFSSQCENSSTQGTNQIYLDLVLFLSCLFGMSLSLGSYLLATIQTRETINTIKHAEDMNMFACGALKQSLHKK